MLSELKRQLNNRLRHATQRAQSSLEHINKLGGFTSDLTVWAGHDYYYWESRKDALEDALDFITDLENTA